MMLKQVVRERQMMTQKSDVCILPANEVMFFFLLSFLKLCFQTWISLQSYLTE